MTDANFGLSSGHDGGKVTRGVYQAPRVVRVALVPRDNLLSICFEGSSMTSYDGCSAHVLPLCYEYLT